MKRLLSIGLSLALGCSTPTATPVYLGTVCDIRPMSGGSLNTLRMSHIYLSEGRWICVEGWPEVGKDTKVYRVGNYYRFVNYDGEEELFMRVVN